MHTLIVAEALPHMQLFARAQLALGNTVGVYTSTPKFKMKRFPENVEHHFVPGPVQLFRGLTMNRFRIPRWAYDWDSDFFDKLASHRVGDCAMMQGAATSSLYTGRAVKKRGGKFVLDRACPDIRVQEAQLEEEARKVGGPFARAPRWFLERQIAEYEEADFIIVPSDYSGRSFPPHLRAKTIICRLTGSVRTVRKAPDPEPRPFTVGVVGGEPLRKGYLYLFEAWKQLGWTDAELKVRVSAQQIGRYPVLSNLVESMPNIKLVEYVPDIADFYRSCDAFILPSTDEGFGLALFEALGQGLPCIATTNCGSSELLTNGEDALLIPPFDVQAIKDALTRLRESPELRSTLSANGIRRIEAMQSGSQENLYQRGVEELMRRAFPATVSATASA